MAWSNRPIAVRLEGVRYGAEGINVYRFRSIDRRPLPEYDPGAHIDLEISDGVTRQYSLLWPAPAPDEYEVAVLRVDDGRGGSLELHRKASVGSEYRISEPRNLFPLERSGDSVLLAGGIGITPIISMFRALKDSRPVQLHYWTRGQERTLFLDELAGDPRACIHFGHPPQVSLTDIVRSSPRNAHLYCCGPGAMLDEFEVAVKAAGFEAHLIHLERFATAVAPVKAGGAFTARLDRSKISFLVEADETLLEACLRHGVDASYSCEEGICGACETRVIAGEIDHRSSVKPARPDGMMICCSRAKGDMLVLDL